MNNLFLNFDVNVFDIKIAGFYLQNKRHIARVQLSLCVQYLLCKERIGCGIRKENGYQRDQLTKLKKANWFLRD